MPPLTLQQTLGMKNSLSRLSHKRMTLTNSFHSMHRRLSNAFQCFCQVKPGKEFSKEITGHQWSSIKKDEHFHLIIFKVLKRMRIRLCKFKLLFLQILTKSTQSGTWTSTKVLVLNKYCCVANRPESYRLIPSRAVPRQPALGAPVPGFCLSALAGHSA